MPPTDRPALPDRHLRVVAAWASHWSCKRAAESLGMPHGYFRQVLADARRRAGAETNGELLALLGWLHVPVEHLSDYR